MEREALHSSESVQFPEDEKSYRGTGSNYGQVPVFKQVLSSSDFNSL